MLIYCDDYNSPVRAGHNNKQFEDKIFTTSNKLSLCVYFTAPDRWFYHGGSTGNCGADLCCEWLPPKANDGTPPAQPPPIKAKWFKIPNDGNCDTVPANVIQGPPMLKANVSSDQICKHLNCS